jgi:deoxyribonuclease V
LIVAVDADYRADSVVTACVVFHAWTDAAPSRELAVCSNAPAAAYKAGSFYERELPYVLAALESLEPELVVIDGYVWLAAAAKGLGGHLHAAIGVPVVGVAKNPFKSAPSIAVIRGASAKPLHVTAAGIEAAEAAEHVRAMHGAFRIPTLLKRADALARSYDPNLAANAR